MPVCVATTVATLPSALSMSAFVLLERLLSFSGRGYRSRYILLGTPFQPQQLQPHPIKNAVCIQINSLFHFGHVDHRLDDEFSECTDYFGLFPNQN